MQHYYAGVPRLGNVAVSRHAQDRMREEGISEHAFETVLYRGHLIPDGPNVTLLERDGIRLVLQEHPEPFRGAGLVKTAYRIKPPSLTR